MKPHLRSILRPNQGQFEAELRLFEAPLRPILSGIKAHLTTNLRPIWSPILRTNRGQFEAEIRLFYNQFEANLESNFEAESRPIRRGIKTIGCVNNSCPSYEVKYQNFPLFICAVFSSSVVCISMPVHWSSVRSPPPPLFSSCCLNDSFT